MARQDRSGKDGAVVVVEAWGLVGGDGLPEGDLVALEGDLERCHARHTVASFETSGRVFGDEGTVGCVSGALSARPTGATRVVQWN